MYDFYKNQDGKYIEGYLSSPDEFNGIVFLLRESDDSNPDNFWFKRAIGGFREEGFNDDRKSRRAATRYINRFVEMLESTPADAKNPAVTFRKEDLNHAVYCNIHPEYGESKETEVCKQLVAERSGRIIEMLSQRHKELTIFTCIDIYDNLKKYLSPAEEKKDGIKYKRKTLQWFMSEKNSCRLRVYKIYHPSLSGKVLKE